MDTKYEFGLDQNGALWLVDEIHTPDSSRYWLLEGSDERLARGDAQLNLDKEFVRQWLISERGFKGDGPAPDIPDAVRVQLADKYCALYEQLTGAPAPLVPGDVQGRIEQALRGRGLL